MGKRRVGQIPVGQMPVDQMFFDQNTWNRIWPWTPLLMMCNELNLYYKNMTIVNDCYKLERHSKVFNYAPRVVNYLSIMLPWNIHSTCISHDDCHIFQCRPQVAML